MPNPSDPSSPPPQPQCPLRLPDGARPCLVLDTNIWLDLLWFRDSRCATLQSAMRAGLLDVVYDDAGRSEWLRVLYYPQLALAEADRERLDAAFLQLGRRFQRTAAPARATVPLPRCEDPDDQVFLELARDADAVGLVTKDLLLLKLARRLALAGLFAVVRPELLVRQPVHELAFWRRMGSGR